MCFAGFLHRRFHRGSDKQTRRAEKHERLHTASRWSDRNYRDVSRALVPTQRQPVEDSSTSAAANAPSGTTETTDGADYTDGASPPATPIPQRRGGGTTATHRRASEH